MRIQDKINDKFIIKLLDSIQDAEPSAPPETRFWQRVDESDILRTDETQIEVFP